MDGSSAADVNMAIFCLAVVKCAVQQGERMPPAVVSTTACNNKPQVNVFPDLHLVIIQR